ncbi:hypothetical protein V1477_008685 [Vespula maculifrons]|uniref:Uncharacterized protein n=1 Tax=Vespula maculifrons TaxID=7453 RepID=A0ABD2CDR0_VESMC
MKTDGRENPAECTISPLYKVRRKTLVPVLRFLYCNRHHLQDGFGDGCERTLNLALLVFHV